MKKPLIRLMAVGAAVGLAVAGCSSSATSSTASPTAVTVPPSSATASESASADSTQIEDGLARLDALREVSETNMQTGDVWTTAVGATDASVETMMAENQKPHAASDDDDYDTADATTIAVSGTSGTVTGSGATATEGTVTISAAGTYIVSGQLDGQIVVDTQDEGKVRLVLDGATIASSTDAAIRIVAADEMVIILADGTENSLSDTSSYAADADGTGAIASKADLTIGGSGTLSVTGNATNAISSSDGLVILGGTINVTSADDGIRGKDYVVIAGGTITVSANGDAIQSTNTDDIGRGYMLMTGGSLTVTGANKAIDAVSDIIIDGGTLDVTSEGDTVEGAYILLADGTGRIVSGDDGLNATADTGTPWVSISGGEWTINAAGDGFDSNGDGYMSGGTLTVYGPTNSGNGAIDVQNGMTIGGGTLFAAGAVGMDEAPSTSSAQTSIKYQASSTLSAGTVVSITDSSGTEIASYTLEKDAQSFVFSAAAIQSGQSYSIVADGSTLGTATGGEYSENTMGGGGPGGGNGGRGGR